MRNVYSHFCVQEITDFQLPGDFPKYNFYSKLKAKQLRVEANLCRQFSFNFECQLQLQCQLSTSANPQSWCYIFQYNNNTTTHLMFWLRVIFNQKLRHVSLNGLRYTTHQVLGWEAKMSGKSGTKCNLQRWFRTPHKKWAIKCVNFQPSSRVLWKLLGWCGNFELSSQQCRRVLTIQKYELYFNNLVLDRVFQGLDM